MLSDDLEEAATKAITKMPVKGVQKAVVSSSEIKLSNDQQSVLGCKTCLQGQRCA